MTTADTPLVTLYSQPGCGPCVGVKTYLQRTGIPHEIRDITTDPEAEAHLRQLGYTGTPVIEHPGGHFKGMDTDKLEEIRVAMFAMA